MSFLTTLCAPSLTGVRLPSDRPIRILFLTSIRDVGECDRNGLLVETGTGQHYMEGVIVALAPGTQHSDLEHPVHLPPCPA
jgi:hypothetical protein